MTPDFAAAPVDLAREASFRLGDLEVRPSTRELVGSAGRQLLEPRLMQVLVVLARRRGEVVSRDELIATCWGGRIVSEDAIQRCIAGLRRQAGGLEIETIARVGYRLTPDEPAAAEPTQALAPAQDRPVLAVLPFDNLSGDPELVWFSDGVSEEILQTVAQRSDLQVIGRSSSFQFRGAEKAARNVAAELGATHLLDGSVRRSGDRVRISAQLVDCQTQTTSWSTRIDRQMTDIFELQDEIATAVAAALEQTLRPSPLRRIAPAAYDLFLRARAASEQWLGGADEVLLRQALDIEPEFPAAWGLLALTRAIKFQVEGPEAGDLAVRTEAIAAAHRALALDPGAGVAYAALSFVEPVCGAFREREAYLDRALDASPEDPWVLFHASRFAWTVGRTRDALKLTRRVRDLDPLWPQGANQHASALLYCGFQAEGEAEYDRARARWPNLNYTAIAPLMRAAQSDNWPRVDRLLEDIRERGPETPQVLDACRQVERLRRMDKAAFERDLRRQGERLEAGQAIGPSIYMFCNRGLGDEAYDLLDRASFRHLFEPGGRLPPREFGLHSLFVELGKSMRADPRFVRLCGKLSLVDYWLSTHRWPDCADEVPYEFRAECRRWAEEQAA